jgi:hypothetical protein
MNPERSPSDIAVEWIEAWTVENSHGRKRSCCELDFSLLQQQPYLCLDAIQEILNRIPADPNNQYFKVLAAGPLEDLLEAHGELLVDQIEILARRSPAFRLLLNGVWPGTIKPKVLDRLSKYRVSPW